MNKLRCSLLIAGMTLPGFAFAAPSTDQAPSCCTQKAEAPKAGCPSCHGEEGCDGCEHCNDGCEACDGCDACEGGEHCDAHAGVPHSEGAHHDAR